MLKINKGFYPRLVSVHCQKSYLSRCLDTPVNTEGEHFSAVDAGVSNAALQIKTGVA